MPVYVQSNNLYFTIARAVLDRGIAMLCSRNPNISYDRCIELISKDLRQLASEYKPNGTPTYNGPIRHLSYVFEYTTLNATAFQRAFLHFPEIDKDVRSKTDQAYSVCAIGGGPGTELLGIMKLLLTTYRNENLLINFTCVDREESWQNIHNYIKHLVLAMIGFADQQHTLIHHGFHLLDLLNDSQVEDVQDLFTSTDLFVLNYVLSESKDRLEEIDMALWKIANTAKTGALFLVIDRLESGSFPSDVEALLSTNLWLNIVGTTKLEGRVSDDIRILERYRKLFDYKPRMWLENDGQSTVFAVLASKPEDWFPF